MKKLIYILSALSIVPFLCVSAFAEDGKSLVFKDGTAQPILQYTNLRDENYTNEGSDILRFCVYVETDHDTDGDGKADLVEALVQVPRAAAEGDFCRGVIFKVDHRDSSFPNDYDVSRAGFCALTLL